MIAEINGKWIMAHVPHKCGKSTVMNFLGFAVTGQVVTKKQVRKRMGDRLIHNHDSWPYYQSNPLPMDFCFAVVRDPVERAQSVWSDRVLAKRKIAVKDRSWDYFAEHFETFLEHPDIREHSQHQHQYMNPDLSFYDRIYCTDRLNTDLRQDLTELLDVEFPPIRANRSRSTAYPPVTESQRVFFEQYYRKDYELFGSIF